MNNNQKLKVALVHDHLAQFGGAERVLSVMHNIFPSAPIYTLFSDPEVADIYFPTADIRTSFLQKFPKKMHKRFRYLAPFAIPAVENFNLQDYDIVISSSAFFAKGVITNPESIHISYCHTPTKYLWEAKEGNAKKQNFIKNIVENSMLHAFRLWDFSAASRVDYYIANSKNTKKTIKKYYKQDSFVVYPSAGENLLENGEQSDVISKNSVLSQLPKKYFLIVSQLQDYKNIDIAVEAFSRLKYPLVIIGDGPERKNLEKIASDNIIFLGRQPDDIVKHCYQNCHAYIYPGKEDFGISAVEAMIFGKPVLALRAGGVLESVVEGVSGEFFDDPHPAVLADAVRRLNDNYDNYNPVMIQNIGNKFSSERFTNEFRRVLKRILAHEWNIV
ncbi:MAG: glycosyltransferase [Candidatus Spechtbacterales bacterium]